MQADNPLCKWFRESFYKEYLSPAISASFGRETMSFHSPLKGSKTSQFPLAPRSHRDVSPSYLRQTMSQLNEQPPEEYVVGCTVCGSKAIEEVEMTHHDNPPKLRAHKCPEVSEVQSNSGAYIKIIERTVEPALETDQEGKVIKKLHYIDGTGSAAKHEPFINIEDYTQCKKISTVLYNEVNPSEHTALTPLNYVERELLKKSFYNNQTATHYVKEDERKRVAIRRNEYANRKKGVSKTMLMKTFTDREGAAFTAEEVAILERIQEEQRKDSEPQIFQMDYLKPHTKSKLSSESFRSPGLSKISKSNASFGATSIRSSAGSVDLTYEGDFVYNEKPLSFKQAMLSQMKMNKNNLMPPKTVWSSSAEQLVLGAVKSKLPRPVEKLKPYQFPKETIQEVDPELEDLSPFNTAQVQWKHGSPNAESNSLESLTPSPQASEQRVVKGIGKHERTLARHGKPSSYEDLEKSRELLEKSREVLEKSRDDIDKSIEIKYESFFDSPEFLEGLRTRKFGDDGRGESKLQQLKRLLSDENVLNGLKFLGAFAEYLEECPEL